MVIIKVALLPHLLRPRQRRYKEKKIQGLQAYSVERLSKSLNKLTHAQSTGRAGKEWKLVASIRELHREAASHGYPKTNCFIRPLSSTTSPTAYCNAQRAELASSIALSLRQSRGESERMRKGGAAADAGRDPSTHTRARQCARASVRVHVSARSDHRGP